MSDTEILQKIREILEVRVNTEPDMDEDGEEIPNNISILGLLMLIDGLKENDTKKVEQILNIL